jgi:hypothetical protein
VVKKNETNNHINSPPLDRRLDGRRRRSPTRSPLQLRETSPERRGPAMTPDVIPNPHVALNNARNLHGVAVHPEMRGHGPPRNASKQSGAAAIENYIDQRDKLWRQLALNNAELSAIAVNLLKDRNDFIEALFRFPKIIKQLFTPDRIKKERKRTKICEAFVEQLQGEIKALMRQAANL